MTVTWDEKTKSYRWRAIATVNGKKKRVGKRGFAKFGEAKDAEKNKLAELAKKEAERAAPAITKRVIPLFNDFFLDQFWNEYVKPNENGDSEQESKLSIFHNHLKHPFTNLRVDEITISIINRLRGKWLNDEKASKKTINNRLAVISTTLRYALACEYLTKVPAMGMFKISRKNQKIVIYTFEQLATFIAAAFTYHPVVYVAALLAADAGLRRGEIIELRWSDIDLDNGILTVRRQKRRKVGTTKGREPREVAMTDRLRDALAALPAREGLVVFHTGLAKWNRRPVGTQMSTKMMEQLYTRICRMAGLPVLEEKEEPGGPRREGEGAWHRLRHTYATHAALFGIQATQLQAWMGHKTLAETERYLHIAEKLSVPDVLWHVGQPHINPKKRTLAMLGARSESVLSGVHPLAADASAEALSMAPLPVVQDLTTSMKPRTILPN